MLMLMCYWCYYSKILLVWVLDVDVGVLYVDVLLELLFEGEFFFVV